MDNMLTVGSADDSQVQLRSAILIYNGQRQTYATLHDIERGRGGARIGAGRPATVEACADFIRALADKSAFSGFLEPRMLYIGPRTVAWWRPPLPARVWFNTTAGPAADQSPVDIGKRSAVTPHPGLVFALHDGHWCIAAVKGRERPGPDTPLFTAPYFNVWDNSQICEGNVTRPENVTPETIAAFEAAFFNSQFTHPNMKKLVQFKGGAGAFWRAMLDGRYKKFPERVLLPRKTKLARWIKQLESR